ncbi:shufflon system plasmid conjugative transfer pilus tip adhesin PilV, partial [Serratia marcescens]
AMQTAGIDSGMTRTTSNAFGYGGQWSETSANFNNITSAGQLAFRVGYNSALYSVYLRRDGTLPMTGDLNLDGHNINNIANINATGNITTTSDLQARNIKATGKVDADGDISAGNWVWAKNGYGDAIGFGGDAYGGDYEIRLGTAKPLTLYSPSAGNYTTVLQVNRNAKIDQRLGLMGYDPNELPSGWGGGLRTLDVYAAGTLATGSGGNLTSYMNATGVHTQSNITASGNIEAAKNVKGATLESTGRATVGEFVQVNGAATIGDVCSPNGLQGRVQSGVPIYCIDGKWQSQGSLVRLVNVYREKQDSIVAACNQNEIVIGGGGNSYNGVGFIDQQGVRAAPGLDGTQPTGDLKGWWVSGVHATVNAENLNAYAICMRIW